MQTIGCEADFQQLASEPIVSTIPGARSLKMLIDRTDGALYFQNSKNYQVHWDFASEHLSGNGRPFAGTLGQFNVVEYYSPSRRFILGAVTRYEGPQVWAFELSPYDTASASQSRRPKIAKKKRRRLNSCAF